MLRMTGSPITSPSARSDDTEIPTFGIIGHFVGMKHFWEVAESGYPGKLRRRKKDLVQKVLEWMPPFHTPLGFRQKSTTGTEIKGVAVMCPLMARQMLMLDEEQVIGKIVDAVKLSERLGAKLAVLTGFTSVVGNQGAVVAKQVNIPVTTGNTFTSALTIRGVERAAELMELPLSKASLAIIGATGDIGSACTRILAPKVAQITLVATKRKRLAEFSSQIQATTNAKVEIGTSASEAVKDKDIIISVTSSVTTLINSEDIKSGAIVCDVAIPKNIAAEVSQKRNDVLVFDGGLVELNQKVYFPGMTPGFLVGCIAEGMILAMEKKFEPYSLGRRNIHPDKVEEIDKLRVKHGFRMERLKIGNQVYSPKDIERIKCNRK